MSKTTSFSMTRFRRITNFRTPDDYQLYIKYSRALKDRMKSMPDGYHKIIVKKRFLRKPTFEIVTIVQADLTV